MAIILRKQVPVLDTLGTSLTSSVSQNRVTLELGKRVNTVTLVSPTSNSTTTYPNVAAANLATVSGDSIYFTGVPDASLALDKPATYEGASTNVGTLGTQILPFPGGANAITTKVRGFKTNGRMVVVKQTVGATAIIEDCVFFEKGFLELFGLGASDNSITNVILIRCRGSRSVQLSNYAPGYMNNNGNIFSQLRNDYGQIMSIRLIDCNFSNSLDSIFTGYASSSLRIYLEGNTVVTPKSGEAITKLVQVSDGAPLDQSVILIDNRTPISGGTYTPPQATTAIKDAVRASAYIGAYMQDATPAGSIEWMKFSAPDGNDTSKTWTYEYIRNYNNTLIWTRIPGM